MAASVDTLIQEASAALKAGRKADARRALDQAIALDERSEQAWLWMSGVVDSDEEQEICLENVLAINPTNQKAQKGLDAIHAKRSAAAAKPAAPFVASDTGRSAPAVSPSAGSSISADLSDWSNWPDAGTSSAPATSVEWGNPKTPPPSDFPSQPSTEEYDNWMAGLSLGKGTASGGTSAESGSTPAFDLLDFDSTPFNSPGFDNGPFSSPSYDPLPGSDAGATIGPFSDVAATPAQESDPFGLSKRAGKAAAAPATGSGQTSFSFKRKIGEPPALAAARKQADSAGTFEDFISAQESPIGAGSPTSPIPEPPASSAAVFTTVDSSSIANPSAYFAAIPDDIRASSVASPLLLITLAALVILNIGSLLWLSSNLQH